MPNDMGIFSPSDPEPSRFEQLAQVVELGLANFRKTGKALREIRDKELYLKHYATFEQCCRTRWNISPQHANRLIDAALFAEALEPTVLQPTSERQVRPLRALPIERRNEAWTDAAAAGGTTEAILAAVKKRKPHKRRPKALRPIRIRAAGGWITIQPNKKFVSVELTLTEAIEQLRERRRAAA